MPRWRAALFAVLLLSVIVPTLGPLITLMSRAIELRPLTVGQRQEKVLGDLYPAVERLRRDIPLSVPLALIGTSRASQDDAVFINFYLYPHPTRTYRDRWEYLVDDPKSRPKTIVALSGGPPRLTSYAELRDIDLRRKRVVRNMLLPPETRTHFAIPIVSSLDGPPPVSYTVEGALATDSEAHVSLTVHPLGIVKQLTIRGTHPFHDLLYQCFGLMGINWVSASSDRPVRAAFWLVNHTARTAVPLRLVDGPMRKAAAFPVSPTAKVWLVNFADEPVLARVGGTDALVPAHAIIAMGATGTAKGPVYAFESEKEPNGQTRFIWPEDLP
jgi:hypothetical protein